MQDLSRAAIVKLTFFADNFFYKTNATGYHITSVLLHFLNTFLATYTLRTLLKLIQPEQLNISNACYIFFFLFLITPIHSEPLCYLLGRAGLIVTLFCTLSLLFFLKANFKRWVLLAFSLLLFLLALFSYEISWTFPLIILAVAYYLKANLKVRTKTVISYVLPYFILFILWFFIKTISIDKLNITPYGNNVFLSLDFLGLMKNFIVLLFRNIIPPFENTSVFVSLSVIAALLFVYFFFSWKVKRKPLIFFSLLMIFACMLAFLPAVVFGINSHNSESERYIYFSSVFAIMFLAVAFSSINNQKIKLVAVAVLFSTYAFFLFETINYYIIGGRFSKSYINLLAKQYSTNKKVFLINQPSQYKGALLFRAYSDEKNSSLNNLYTINDYMHNLNNTNNATYITLSKKEISENDVIKQVVVIPVGRIQSVFAEFSFNVSNKFLINSLTGDTISFEKGNNIIIGLKLPNVYVFK